MEMQQNDKIYIIIIIHLKINNKRWKWLQPSTADQT